MYQFHLHNILYYLLGSSTVHTGSSRRGTTWCQNYYGLGVYGFEFASMELANPRYQKREWKFREESFIHLVLAFGCGSGSRLIIDCGTLHCGYL